MNKRLTLLERMVQEKTADSFARYALALEYKKAGLSEKALQAFADLRATDPDYLAQYLMAGQMLIEQDRPAEARDWLEAGIAVAGRVGDQKALSELSAALAEI
jgi:predicted Zn-dependent protease